MTVLSSFTLCPSAAVMKPIITESSTTAAAVLEKSADVVRQGNAYQPFHPLVHHRNIPKSGVITPFHSWQRRQQHNASVVEVTGQSRLACDPPLNEIQVPATSTTSSTTNNIKTRDDEQNDDDDDDNNSWIAGESGEDNDYEEHSFERMESWKSMYFVAQRDLHVAREESQAIYEENRRLKRHLFELQRRLYESQRKRQHVCNDMWNVPTTEPSLRRQQQPQNENTSATDNASGTHLPRAISSEESSACRDQSKASVSPASGEKFD